MQQYQSLLDQAIDTYVAIVKRLSFPALSRILKLLVHKLEKKINTKVVIRLISHLLNGLSLGQMSIASRVRQAQEG